MDALVELVAVAHKQQHLHLQKYTKSMGELHHAHAKL
jgi:hypothetical protein